MLAIVVLVDVEKDWLGLILQFQSPNTCDWLGLAEAVPVHVVGD